MVVASVVWCGAFVPVIECEQCIKGYSAALQLRAESDNIWAAVGPDGAFVEQRWRLPHDSGNWSSPEVRRADAHVDRPNSFPCDCSPATSHNRYIGRALRKHAVP